MGKTVKTPETRQRLLDLAELGLSYAKCARGAGIGESTFKKWRAEDEDLVRDLEAAQARFLEAGHRKVKDEGSAADTLRLMAMRFPDEYGERREEVHKIVLELPGLLRNEQQLLEVDWEEVDKQAKKGELPAGTIELLGLAEGPCDSNEED